MPESTRKTQKNLHLPIEVCDELEEEENQSELVEYLLRAYFMVVSTHE